MSKPTVPDVRLIYTRITTVIAGVCSQYPIPEAAIEEMAGSIGALYDKDIGRSVDKPATRRNGPHPMFEKLLLRFSE